MKIEHTTSPSSKDIEFLLKKINEETVDKGTCNPFVFFIRDDTEQIIVGVAVLLSMVQFTLTCFGCTLIIEEKVWESS
ncbi:hypothetical protein [Wolbachia sp. wLmal]|uniref:hypothetical protein n=1 Tax=Wolbachia sp. wLmal TaxID=3342489 RepID=UPI003C2F0F7D